MASEEMESKERRGGERPHDDHDDHDDHDPMPEGKEPPPPGIRTMAIVRWALVAVSALLALGMWLSYARAEHGRGAPGGAMTAPKYHCPMHPQIVSDEPGECPICHMNLEPIANERSHAPEPPRPMASSAPSSAAEAGAPGATPAGTTPITLALDRVQAIGVRTAVAESGLGHAGVRATAVVMPTEDGISEVHVRAPGFVESIQVGQTGIAVRAGQPLLTFYSPELLQAQNELLATRRWQAASGGGESPSPTSGSGGGSGSGSGSGARHKLELLGMSASEIDRVAEKGEPMRAITITAPRAGIVSKKSVVQGSYVTAETVLYELQDLSRVWVVADVFLADVPDVKVGTEATFVPAGRADRSATGKIDLLYPLVSTEARTRRVRMQVVDNHAKGYAPGEYGVLELTTPARQAVTIPRDAVIDTGTATYVFLALEGGRFEPRIVSVHDGHGDVVVVEAGLARGDRVVSGAVFLIDSESRLQASIMHARSDSER